MTSHPYKAGMENAGFSPDHGEGWKTAALEPCKWWEVVMEGGRTCMAIWRKEKEREAEVRRNKIEAKKRTRPPLRRV